ncbi:hypothetical protein Trydic_g15963 [Trypoxylus dichotomus]
MAEQYQKLVNKQYNSPINLYSDKNVREILERETRVLANGAIGIDFNNPMTNKPANLQNSAVLRMLEEEENRKRSGQPGSLKRVAWPPPSGELEEFIEQEPVHSQGGPLYSSPQSVQNNQAQPTQPKPQTQQSPSSPVILQQPQQYQPSYQQQQPKSPQNYANAANSFQPIISPAASTASLKSAGQSSSVGQSGPLSPNVSRSPVSFTNVAKPWSPQNRSSFEFKPVQPPSLRTIQSYQQQQSSEQYRYAEQQRYRQEQTGETQTVYRTEETTIQQYQTSPVEVSQSLQQSERQIFEPNQSEVEVTRSVDRSPSFTSTTSIEIQQEISKAPKSPVPVATVSQSPKPIVSDSPLLKTVTPIQKPSPPKQTQPTPIAAKGVAQNQAPAPQRYQVPAKPVEPPPSTITLRPQAPVSQAPPPLVTSQPATATLRGGKNLRGDLKWPPEVVKEKMAAEQQHLVELAKGPACRPRKNCKDYSSFFAKHALTHAYPGYKIPPGTQFYDHNPVM